MTPRSPIWILRAMAYRTAMAALVFLVRPKRRVSYPLTILKLDRLGDAVLSLGAVRRMVSHAGPENVLLVVSDTAEPLYRMEFPETKRLVLPAFSGRFWPDFALIMFRHAATLRGIATERLVCLRHQPSDYLHAVVQLLAPKQCHASAWETPWERTCLSYPACHFTPYPVTVAGVCLELEAHRRVVGDYLGLNLDIDEVMPSFASVRPVRGQALLACPTSGAALRQYPASLLARTIRLVLADKPGLPIIFCLPPEADQAPWAAALKAEGVEEVEWCRPENVRGLVKLIAEARVVLAPDSAPAHLATALDKPGVFLLGGGHFGMFAPWQRSARQVWLGHPMDCYQCRWCCIHSEALCLTQIAPAVAARALLEVLPGDE